MPAVSLSEARARFARFTEAGGNPFLFAAAIMADVGICDDSGKRYLREDSSERVDTPSGPVGGDVPTLGPKPRRRPTDFRWDVLAEAMIGPDWKDAIGLEREGGSNVVTEMEKRGKRVRMFSEEATAASTGGPALWANVAAWIATVGGLMQAQFLTGYQVADYGASRTSSPTRCPSSGRAASATSRSSGPSRPPRRSHRAKSTPT